MPIADNRMILEAIVTTELPDGSMHVAPMGPEVDDTLNHWKLKPFKSSTTFSNLQRTNRCVVHVVDDAVLLAEAVLGKANHYAAQHIDDCGFALDSACHWYALEVDEWNTAQPRAIAHCRLTKMHSIRPFFGWNRAKHAIVEMAILASRVHILERSVLDFEVDRYRIVIEKTAGQRERKAFEMLENFIRHSKGRTSD
ncbi:MAG: DUF447 family protein [Pirellulaceae bacterium]|nr:DUF447 family protein [Pirellulaceae bacterium]